MNTKELPKIKGFLKVYKVLLYLSLIIMAPAILLYFLDIQVLNLDPQQMNAEGIADLAEIMSMPEIIEDQSAFPTSGFATLMGFYKAKTNWLIFSSAYGIFSSITAIILLNKRSRKLPIAAIVLAGIGTLLDRINSFILLDEYKLITQVSDYISENLLISGFEIIINTAIILYLFTSKNAKETLIN